MKKILIISILLISISTLQAQTNSLYFTKNIFQTTELNPARQLPCKFSLGLPVISSAYIDLLNKNFDYSSLFVEDASGNFSPNLDGFYDGLNNNNYILVNNKIALLSMGLWIKDFYVLFDINLNNNIHVGIPKSTYEYTMTVAGEINSSAWLTSSSDTLNGIADVNFNGLEGINEFVEEVTTNYRLPFDKVFNKPNLGLGLDLGVIYKLNNQFEFSASVLDFGFISWQNSPLSISIEEKEFVFSGLDIGQYLGDSTIFSILRNQEMKDSIMQSIQGDMLDTLLSLQK